jgi:hypothetical protein
MSIINIRKLSNNLHGNEMRIVGSGDHTMKEIYSAVKAFYPELCDDSVLCTHDGRPPYRPEWHHVVRSVLQSLRNRGIISHPRRNCWRFR